MIGSQRVAAEITRRLVAMRETSEDEAFMVDPLDVDSIASGIILACKFSPVAGERESRAKRMSQKFDWATDQVQTILESYE